MIDTIPTPTSEPECFRPEYAPWWPCLTEDQYNDLVALVTPLLSQTSTTTTTTVVSTPPTTTTPTHLPETGTDVPAAGIGVALVLVGAAAVRLACRGRR
jgi:hypothetical protein